MKTIKKQFIAILCTGILISQTLNAQKLIPQKITLQELIDSLLQNNIHLQIANTSVNEAKAQVANGKMNQLPNFGVDMTGMYLSNVAIYDPDWEKVTTENIPHFGHQFNASLNQLLYSGGKVNKSIGLAKLNEELARNQLADTELNMKYNAAQLYIGLYQLQNQLEILKKNKDLAESRLQNVQNFYAENMVTKNDVLRAEVFNSELEQATLTVENSIQVTNRNLVILTGLNENTNIIPDITDMKHEVAMENEFYFRDLAFHNNPKLSISSTQIAMAEKNLELTGTDLLPTVAAFAGYGFTRPITSSSPALDYYANSYQVGINISYNIESLYKNRKKAAVNKIQIEKSRQAKEATLQKINSDINAAYNNYKLVLEQKKVSEKSEIAANENYRISELKYQNQLITMVEMVDASNTKLNAELQTLNTEMNIILNYVKLLQVAGQF